MSNFDDELDADVRRILTPPGEEERRAMGVRGLHTASPLGILRRVAVVTIGIAVVVVLYYALGGTLALRAIDDLCQRLQVCV